MSYLEKSLLKSLEDNRKPPYLCSVNLKQTEQMNRSELFKSAHTYAKSNEGQTYRARFAQGLKLAYEQVKNPTPTVFEEYVKLYFFIQNAATEFNKVCNNAKTTNEEYDAALALYKTQKNEYSEKYVALGLHYTVTMKYDAEIRKMSQSEIEIILAK